MTPSTHRAERAERRSAVGLNDLLGRWPTENQMNAEREMTLDEWCAKLPESHAVNQQLRALTHCRNHPFKWAVWDTLRKIAPFIRWRSPAA